MLNKDGDKKKKNSLHQLYPHGIQRSYSKESKKCDCFLFTHILLYKFNPIRNQLETVLDFWLDDVFMKEC